MQAIKNDAALNLQKDAENPRLSCQTLIKNLVSVSPNLPWQWKGSAAVDPQAVVEWKKKRPKIVITKGSFSKYPHSSDMMKDFPFPRPEPQPPIYYRLTKLKVITLGASVNTAQHSNFHCMLWSQYDGQKKSQDICSALWGLYQDIQDPCAHLIAWSDNCVAQNTSWMLLFFHAFLVKQQLQRCRCKIRNNRELGIY